MAHIISLLLLAFAVSLDSFSVGFTYGLRKVRIPLKSILVISGCSAVVLIFAMAVGHLIENFFSPKIAQNAGGYILILLGAWIIYQFFRPEKMKEQTSIASTIINFEIKSLGLVINILRKPMSADFDKSGTIAGLEALLLGIALSLDAFGAGIGAAMLGFSPLYLAISVAIMSSLFVFVGMKLGSVFAHFEWIQKFTFLPGILLIVIGIWKL
ncbi:sporulation membrane protein YtaF [Bacillus sp. 1NLA3E]|uniref:sporulation membrane protein YtaF n=1 Tax=Bacillus sp. 1NLA3E TaxID=666686 RepID=UPI000247E91A|nr:sporulation membrane protein YtaF [Bacillus sp. 1NLA3E]AGK55168.1 putative sporulation protein YtaF [Bacillus sp. 1NLA3E]